MAAVSSSPMHHAYNNINSTIDSESFVDVDKLTYEIFSILENKFLFGYDEINPKNVTSLSSEDVKSNKRQSNGKVRILCIDGGCATDGILAAKSLFHLEACLRSKSGNPNARISDYFDVAAGSGAGGILAALLFTRGKDGLPLFTAEGALKFMTENRRKIFPSSRQGLLRRVFKPAKAEKLFSKTFGECTLRDTLKAVLIPCYDLSTRAPFLFSRADAAEIDGYDFKMRDVCAATSADPTTGGKAVEMWSVDWRTKIVAVDGGITMNNPTGAAITHVLNNKQEFPLCKGVEDLLVVSLGNGESEFGSGKMGFSPASFARIAGEGNSDTVDQAVSMAFGHCRVTNYARIQGNCIVAKMNGTLEKTKRSTKDGREILEMTEEMLAQKNVEAVLFEGKKMVETTNLEKIERFGGELIKEQERRKASILPTVVLKQTSPSPRTSSATTLSTLSSC